MKRKNAVKVLISSIALVLCSGLVFYVKPDSSAVIMGSNNVPEIQNNDTSLINSEITTIKSQAENINVDVLKLSLVAYQHALQKGITHSPMLTIIDYSKPSSERRLWVVNLDTEKVLFNTWVAHGKNSGDVNASSFSNSPSSLKSSLGVFLTGDTYIGKHGTSLHIQGLEPGINNNAYDRSIVIHGANYVSGALAKNSHKIGRSWGCPAVSMDVINPLIADIKDKALIVAYYPDQNWLHTSSFFS